MLREEKADCNCVIVSFVDTPGHQNVTEKGGKYYIFLLLVCIKSFLSEYLVYVRYKSAKKSIFLLACRGPKEGVESPKRLQPDSRSTAPLQLKMKLWMLLRL